MTTSRNVVRAVFVVLAIAGVCGRVDAAGFQPESTVLRDDIVYNINADGTSTADRVESLRIETAEGVRHLGQIPLRYSTSLQDLSVVEAYAQLPGPGAMRVPAGLNSFSGIAVAFAPFGPATRESPLIFLGRHISETVQIDLPSGVKVSALPRPVQITSSFGTYSSAYAQTGQSITVTRSLDLTTHSALVEAAQYPELRKMALAVKRDLSAQIVY